MRSIRNLVEKILLAMITLSMASCMKIYGLKRVRAYTPAQIEQWNTVHGISGNAVFNHDYKQRLAENISDKGLKKDLRQPLQYWIFDNGELISNMVNCDAGGFPNLKWPIEKNFVGKTINAKNTGPDFYTRLLRAQKIDPGNNTHIMVVNYSRFMGRQNKRFLKECKAFIVAHPKYRAYYNNMDNTFIVPDSTGQRSNL
ncbi:MAG: hypothetical protein KF744_07210 [Taibaiella sp.]|nr:hypothetical protein [Taibaiella sp.]